MFDISQARRLATMAAHSRQNEIELEEEAEFQFLQEQEKDILRLMIDGEFLNFLFDCIDDNIQAVSKEGVRDFMISRNSLDAVEMNMEDRDGNKWYIMLYCSRSYSRKTHPFVDEMRGIVERFPWINFDDAELMAPIVLATLDNIILPLYQEEGYSIGCYDDGCDRLNGFVVSW